MYFNKREVGQVSELKFFQTEGAEDVCNLVSPFGNGSMRLNWANFNNALHGTLYIDRNRLGNIRLLECAVNVTSEQKVVRV